MRVAAPVCRCGYAQWFDPILAQPIAMRDGHAIVGERPGSGVEWDEDAVHRYLVE
jgi:mandelate racemase